MKRRHFLSISAGFALAFAVGCAPDEVRFTASHTGTVASHLSQFPDLFQLQPVAGRTTWGENVSGLVVTMAHGVKADWLPHAGTQLLVKVNGEFIQTGPEIAEVPAGAEITFDVVKFDPAQVPAPGFYA